MDPSTGSGQSIFIAGGGAAGFFAAIECAEQNPASKVVILERSNKVLSKVRVSGGGRCNVTHDCESVPLLVKQYPRGEKELRQVFARFRVADTVKWFAGRGVELKTEPDGRMFPATNTSETIVNCLQKAAEAAGVKVWMGAEIIGVSGKGNALLLSLKDGQEIPASRLLVATGGNAHNSAYDWLRKLGHTIVPPVPSLFTFNVPSDTITKLMGVSVPDARVRIAGTKLEQRGPLLITHWGLSGPAVLKTSAWGARVLNELNYDFECQVNWLPELKEDDLRYTMTEARERFPSRSLYNHCPFELPSRLWQHLLERSGVGEELRFAELPKKELNKLIGNLSCTVFRVKGKTTFKEEFVTCGGVDLKEIDLKTMQSKLVPGLFFAGEVLNVDGVTGGFNFQNAWSTAFVAARGITGTD